MRSPLRGAVCVKPGGPERLHCGRGPHPTVQCRWTQCLGPKSYANTVPFLTVSRPGLPKPEAREPTPFRRKTCHGGWARRTWGWPASGRASRSAELQERSPLSPGGPCTQTLHARYCEVCVLRSRCF